MVLQGELGKAPSRNREPISHPKIVYRVTLFLSCYRSSSARLFLFRLEQIVENGGQRE